MSTDRNNQISGVTSVNSGPLIIRTYNNQSGNNTYLVTDYEYPVSTNYVLITSSGGRLAPSNDIYVSSISASTMNMGTILAQHGTLSSLTVSTLTVPGLSVTSFSTLTGNTLIASSILTANLVTSTLVVNSSMISIGQLTNQQYTQMAYGNTSTSSNWITSLTPLVSTNTVSMSANAQKQLVISQVSTAGSVHYTNTLGAQWVSLSNAMGLPNSLETIYSAGAISGNGQYGILAASGGYLYRTMDAGDNWINTNPNTGSLYTRLSFEGNTNDVSGNGRHATATGSPGYVPGIVGKNAINLVNPPAGTATQYVRGSWTTALTFAISFWCNPQSAASSMIIFSIGGLLTIQTNGAAGLQFYAPGISVSVPYPVTRNTWYNITVIYQANSTCYFYVNNVLIASPTSTGIISDSQYGLGTYSATTTNAFNGYIDDFKIYVPSPSIYLPFETVPVNGESGGTTLTVVGNPTLVAGIGGTNAINLVNTPAGTATQYIRGSWINGALTTFTVSFWFNMQSTTTGYSYIFSAFNGAFSVIISTDVLSANIPKATAPYYMGFAPAVYQTIAVNTWYNVTIVFQSAGTCTFYLNNAVYATLAGAGVYGGTTSNLFGLSGYDSDVTQAFNGYIDDLRIYNSPISSIPFSPMVPQNWSNVAVSNSGQYMLATATGAGLYLSSNYGSTWSQVTGSMLYAAWTSAQVSATGQYMLANSPQMMVQPQLTGLTSSGTNLITNPWQTGGITWIASGSSTLSGFPISAAFDTFGNTWWGCSAPNANYTSSTNSSAFYTTIIGIGSIQGDWVQIQSSVPLQMYSYQLGNGGGLQMVKSFYIVGSTDNTNWYPIQRGIIAAIPVITYAITEPILVTSSATQTIGTSTITKTNYETTRNMFTYFRIICTTNFNSIIDYVTISEWIINFQAGGQTYSTTYGATWNNAYALYSGQIQMTSYSSGLTVTPQLTGLTGASNSISWQANGVTWTSSSSTVNSATYYSYKAFDNTNGPGWLSTVRYADNGTVINGTTATTLVTGVGTVTGEYLQLQSSGPLVMYRFALGIGPNAYPNTNTPLTYYIVGSNDAITWYPLQSGIFTISAFSGAMSMILINSSSTQTISGGATGTVITTATSYSTLPYTYFRLIGTQLMRYGGLGQLSNYMEIGEWYINGTIPSSIPIAIISPSTTLSLSPSGQTALSTTIQNPILISELNFEGTYNDSIVGGLTYISSGNAISISSVQVKVGSTSLLSTNSAGVATSNYLYYSITNPITMSEYTMGAWIYPTALPSTSSATPFGLSTSSITGPYLTLLSTGQFQCWYYTTTSLSGLSVTTTTLIPINTWSHIAVVFSMNTVYVYINGILQITQAYTGTPCMGNGLAPTNVVVGCAVPGYNGYAGYIDNLRIYNAALTPYQMQVIYANNVTSTILTQLVPSFSVTPQQVGLTTNTWNQGGIAWRASASSTYTGTVSEPYMLFNTIINYTGADCWASNFGYNTTTGAYTGTAITSVTGQGTISGEWFQLQTSVPLVLYSYCYTVLNNTSIAKTYYIVGSLDGITWYPIQTGVFSGTIPFTIASQTQTNVTYVNYNGVQPVLAGTSQPITTATFPTTTTAYTYFRVIGQTLWPMNAGLFEYAEFVPMFTGPTNTSLYNVVSPITNFSTGSVVTSGTIPGIITGSAISTTGQYMVLITNATTEYNVYYSTNYGVTFVGVLLDSAAMTSCAISYDGSYITVTNATTVYQLNNNSNGYSVAIGNQAGQQNQAQNAIAIGNYAGYQNQSANSIILNASGLGTLGQGLNAVAQGFYVAPIASYTASTSPYLSVMGYGLDNQVTHSNGAISMLSNGNVGIGTTNPTTALTLWNQTTRYVSPTISLYGYSDVAGSGPGITFYAFYSAITPQGRIEVFDAGNYGGNMIFSLKENAGTALGPVVERMRIAENGNVGIGTNAPTANFQVWGSSQFSNVVSISVNNLYIGSGGSINQAINMGYQGITYYYTSDNATYFRLFNAGSNIATTKVYIDWPGTVSTTNITYSPGASGWVFSSDIRLKTNIIPLSSCLTNILALQPVSYQWIVRHNPDQVCYGFIAQHTQQILPEIIEEHDTLAPDGTPYLSIQSNMNAFIVKAIQEQHATITALEAQVLALKATVDALVASR